MFSLFRGIPWWSRRPPSPPRVFANSNFDRISADCKIEEETFSVSRTTQSRKEFEQEELKNPSPRKEVDGRFVYVSRQLNAPEDLAPPVLCDFGSVLSGEQVNTRDVQPDLYRSPEIILSMPWSYEIDIWNVGCMVWDMFEGGHLFTGRDPEYHAYRSRTHLASIIALLGLPRRELIARGRRGAEFFTEDGAFKPSIPLLPPPRSLEYIETNLQGEDKERFLHLIAEDAAVAA